MSKIDLITLFGWSSSIHSCNFHGNNALRFGGSVNLGFTDISTVTWCNFTENDATYGGAISLSQGSSLSIRLCNFTENNATYGGAIYLNNARSSSIYSCNFYRNRAVKLGSSIALGYVNISVINPSTSYYNRVFDHDQRGQGGAVSVFVVKI